MSPCDGAEIAVVVLGHGHGRQDYSIRGVGGVRVIAVIVLIRGTLMLLLRRM